MGSPELASLYQQVILEASKQKHGFGLRPEPHPSNHQLNPTCGDEITLQLVTDSSGEHVEKLAWEGQGCSISMASASLLTDLTAGLPVAELPERIGLFRELMQSKGAGVEDDEPLGDAAALEGVSRYIARVKCAMLAWTALEGAMMESAAK
ncbi:SUF system NifU family Fe-S cluster assembly protein [Mycetocola tolaasinivorans]|uniref:SUF system NifU family Fe-S cluster assembly protein n=1 Tax=Mycetocola tolaasinivorans TaxID=76635 RepID=A0A3L7A5E6_9MICO|nr:SUF system NifU family Fe-S cluster assembly protein [Mycetocola tolaasinivorans]RLP75529.1 SUF system NifU family Fe-S cluster assembly protein [Mycetocola tolaasinivorans]